MLCTHIHIIIAAVVPYIEFQVKALSVIELNSELIISSCFFEINCHLIISIIPLSHIVFPYLFVMTILYTSFFLSHVP
jgi:hypothetical protein